MADLCSELLLTSLTIFYNKNPSYKIILKNIIDGKHKLSLRMIDWFVTQYSKIHNIIYWIHNDNIYDLLPDDIKEFDKLKKINLYYDYRDQLRSYTKLNFDSFRRHNRITFFINEEKTDKIETTIGQLNFFRWIFNNKILLYALNNYDKIYNEMIVNNSYNKGKKKEKKIIFQELTKNKCILIFD